MSSSRSLQLLSRLFRWMPRKKDECVKLDALECIFDIVKQMLEGIWRHQSCNYITWSQFRANWEDQNSISDDEYIMKAITLTLTNYWIIIYANTIAQYIVLDPRRVCNQVVGCLIPFPGCKASRTIWYMYLRQEAGIHYRIYVRWGLYW